MDNSFYTYLYLREDGSPYYVGKGQGDRVFVTSPNHYPPKDTSRIRIYPMSDEDTALAYERYFIDFWGRKDNGTGILHNLTDGGENPPNHKGLPKSSETRKRMRKPKSDEHRKNISKGRTGMVFSKEHLQHMAEVQRGKHHSETTKAKQRQAALGKKHPWAKTMCESRKGDPKWIEHSKVMLHTRWHVNLGVIKEGCSLCQHPH
jgi:hypothetical protein